MTKRRRPDIDLRYGLGSSAYGLGMESVVDRLHLSSVPHLEPSFPPAPPSVLRESSSVPAGPSAVPAFSAPYVARPDAPFLAMQAAMPEGLKVAFPFYDEAAAALWGHDRWRAYLMWSGDRTLFRQNGVEGGQDLVDLAPRLADVSFDRTRACLVSTGLAPRRRAPAAIVARELESRVGPPWAWSDSALQSAAMLEAKSDLVVWREDLPDDSLSRLFRCLLAAPEDWGLPKGEPTGLSLADELAISLVTMLDHGLKAGTWCDAQVRAFPFYGIPEGKSLRMMTFAAAHLALAAFTVEARTAGPWWAAGNADPSVSTLPERVEGWTPPRLDVESFYEQMLAWAPFLRRAVSGHDYRPADLAEGIEHLRWTAFADVACWGHRLGERVSSVGDVAFWQDGITQRTDGILLSRGFRPLVGPGCLDLRLLETEPDDLVVSIRDARVAYGIVDHWTSDAERLRDAVKPVDLPAWSQDPDVGTYSRREGKIAAIRRRHAERVAMGLPAVARPVRPKLSKADDVLPNLSLLPQLEYLQAVPVAECPPFLKKKPSVKLGPYGLEVPPFVTAARLKREADLAKAQADAALLKMLPDDFDDDLGDNSDHELDEDASDGQDV